MKVETPPTPLSASNVHEVHATFSPQSHPGYQPDNHIDPRTLAPSYLQAPHFAPQQIQNPVNTTNISQPNMVSTMTPNGMYITTQQHQHQSPVNAGPFVLPPNATSTNQNSPLSTMEGGHPQLKRNSLTMLEGFEVGDDPQKRARLEDPQQLSQASESYAHAPQSHQVGQDTHQAQGGQYASVYAPIPTEPISAPLLDQTAMISGSIYSMDAGLMPGQIHEMGEEELEYEVEVGPDGLRLVGDCLEQLFERQDGGGMLCKLCV